MIMSDQRGVAIIRAMSPGLEAQGYEVFLQPPRTMLPPFMGKYRPDAIAIKQGRNIAFEVKPANHEAEQPQDGLTELFVGRTDWELRVIYAPQQYSERPISAASRAKIEEGLNRLAQVVETAGGVAAALLMAWSVLEAAARFVLPDDLAHPQSAARLTEVLASKGYIEPDEADLLLRIGRLRNQAAHGLLDVEVSRRDIDDLIRVIRLVLESSAGPT